MTTGVAVEPQANFIGGKWVPAASGKTFENRNPADRDDLVGVYAEGGKEDVDAAVAAAKKAFPGWRDTPAPRRAEVLYAAGDILVRDKEKLARLMTREMGKVLAETRGDVQEADRHGVSRGRRGPPPLRIHDSVGAARTSSRCASGSRRRLRVRDSLELSDGDSRVEVHGGADRGQHDRHQAGHRHAGFGRRARESLRGGGSAAPASSTS